MGFLTNFYTWKQVGRRLGALGLAAGACPPGCALPGETLIRDYRT